MPSNTGYILWKIYQGQSPARIFMNQALSQETLRGRVVDVGGGRKPDYFNFFQKDNVTSIEPLDGALSGIDFEKDNLPYITGTIDTIVACNVLEHIYNHSFLLKEMNRILRKESGKLIGFVPFWVGYHPDPHDYFRYTKEALERLLTDAEFSDVSVRKVGGGPLLANFNTIVLSVPRVIRPVLYIPYMLLDKIFISFRPQSKERNPLGFIFVASKPTRDIL